MNDRDDNTEPDFVDSPLSQSVTRNGVEVRVEIYGDSPVGGVPTQLVGELTLHGGKR